MNPLLLEVFLITLSWQNYYFIQKKAAYGDSLTNYWPIFVIIDI